MSFYILKGKILKYLSYRGYGFIETEESDDNIFFHISNYPRYEIPSVGQEVEFNVVETPKGKEAQEIKTIVSSQDRIEETETTVEDIPVGEKQAEEDI
ncbi:MAG: cold shock domain-containing protein, partial [Candidatus Thorarchaeota archaeon]|nr:cold shock domain-containing protein [Candidatus Thorarchaeota archaeon]NIW15712.1 cold shock domain-containing protein [Candidatus Thorarchaeota archaeon]